DTVLQITMPSSEAGYEPIARAMRRFVVATGRCTDIPPELYQDENGQFYFGSYRETDVEDELERALEHYQTEYFGDCYLTNELLYSICESFQNGNDVELRKQKNGIDIIKLIKKKVSTEKKRLSQNQKAVRRKPAMDYALQLMMPESGILGVGTPLERYYHNVQAIQLLKKLESEHRIATPTEQSILAEYVGWGGLADCFDEKSSHYLEVKSLLTEDEYWHRRIC
ncbi:MAG: hypothetical protein AB7C89_04690, partial [Intestinibacillus sp.]